MLVFVVFGGLRMWICTCGGHSSRFRTVAVGEVEDAHPVLVARAGRGALVEADALAAEVRVVGARALRHGESAWVRQHQYQFRGEGASKVLPLKTTVSKWKALSSAGCNPRTSEALRCKLRLFPAR